MASMDSAVAQAEVLKSEGNTHFKQQQYELAVRAYSTALERLSGAADTEEEQQVAAAVRLNRAWAMLEAGNSDEKWLRTAESDCSEVLAMDAGCVKALYRRALARERLGAYAGAMADAQRMKALEPVNPFVGPLVQRLEPLVSTSGESSKAADSREHPVESLEAKMDSVSVAESPVDANQPQTTQQKESKVDADAVWRALQEEERCLRRTFKPAAPKKQHRQPRSAKCNPAASPAPRDVGEINKKTDALWALLDEEEAKTMAKVFTHSSKPNRASKSS